MSGRHDRSLSNVTVTQKVGSRVSERYWPLRQVVGRRPDGSCETREVYVDMHSTAGGQEAQVYDPGDAGWNGAPPNLVSGDHGREAFTQPASQRYRERYGLIDWGR